MKGWDNERAGAYTAGRIPSPADDRVVGLISGGRRVLELGCGPALVSGRLDADLLVCTDVTWGFLPVARVNAPASTVMCADPVHLPFSDGVFDTVLAMAVLHHLAEGELEAALHEARRVLEPMGRFMLLEDWAFTAPTPAESMAKAIRFQAGNDEFHLSFQEWDRVFGEAGFVLLTRHWPSRLFQSGGSVHEVRMMAALYERLP